MSIEQVIGQGHRYNQARVMQSENYDRQKTFDTQGPIPLAKKVAEAEKGEQDMLSRLIRIV
jgi:hypothetical protein